jgi:hypothetical protein
MKLLDMKEVHTNITKQGKEISEISEKGEDIRKRSHEWTTQGSSRSWTRIYFPAYFISKEYS